MNLISTSSTKESLFDLTNPDMYGVIKLNAKKDCLDTGNSSETYPSPYVCLDEKVHNAAQLISSQLAFRRKVRRI